MKEKRFLASLEMTGTQLIDKLEWPAYYPSKLAVEGGRVEGWKRKDFSLRSK